MHAWSTNGMDRRAYERVSCDRNAVVTMHVPVYEKEGSVYVLKYFYVIRVESAHPNHRSWHFRHSPCVVFRGVEWNVFYIFGKKRCLNAPAHQNIAVHMDVVGLNACVHLSEYPGYYLVQNKTSIIVRDGHEVKVCPIFDHEIMFKACLRSSAMEGYAASVCQLQTEHFERAWAHISYVQTEQDLVEGGSEMKDSADTSSDSVYDKRKMAFVDEVVRPLKLRKVKR